jgi:hypothetical protein
MAVCRYHPDRPGVGVCIRCRVVICAACCTRLDGVNHCHACLKALAQRDTAGPRGNAGIVLGGIGVIGLAWLVFFGICWLIQGLLVRPSP